MDTSEVTTGSDISRFLPAPKSRSCVVCRSRKVRCDKLNPCSNCRKANVTCVFPANNRPPKWARRLERISKEAGLDEQPTAHKDGNVQQVMQRLQSLEGLVKDLSGQLEHANSASPSAIESSSGIGSPDSSGHGHDHSQRTAPSVSDIQEHAGRLIIQDKNRSRYLSSAFWSRVNDELDGLKMATQKIAGYDSDSSDNDEPSDKTVTTQELSRTPSERHGFLFRHNLGSSSVDLREFHPLPSQIPFLLDTFAENVNYIVGVLHMPTIRKVVKDIRGSDGSGLSAPNEALLFSIYYAAVTSMEDEDIINNFGTTKAELNLKYRLGLEHTLAKADFLNVPDLVLTQAFAIFLLLARRHDSPRFIWMMTGLLIRMAQSLGLQRDGTNFPNLTPYEIEMRRRLWWLICLLDLRASEDQASEITIMKDSFDTKLPSNFYDADINPEVKEMLPARQDITEITAARVCYEMCEVTREMVAPGGKHDSPPSLETQNQLIDTLFQKLDAGYLQHAGDAHKAACWMATASSLLLMSKMRLLIHLPLLFSSPDEHFSDELRNKLLISAIEVAEYNHALNAEEAVRAWRWIYQVYTHWYAIVYLLMEVARRPLLPTIERAWIALQSKWLIPSQSQLDRNNRHWVPLRKLMAKARKHREEELLRLRNDSDAAHHLVLEDKSLPIPSSPGPFAGGNSSELFLSHWQTLVSFPTAAKDITYLSHRPSSASAVAPKYDQAEPKWPNATTSSPHGSTVGTESIAPTNSSTPFQTQAYNTTTTVSDISAIPIEWMSGQDTGVNVMHWSWDDFEMPMAEGMDLNVDMAFDGDINWQNWLDATKDLA